MTIVNRYDTSSLEWTTLHALVVFLLLVSTCFACVIPIFLSQSLFLFRRLVLYSFSLPHPSPGAARFSIIDRHPIIRADGGRMAQAILIAVANDEGEGETETETEFD